MVWATYYGGIDLDYIHSCTTDASGNVYAAGSACSQSGIASGGHQTVFGGSSDLLLVKFNAAGVRQWATYYGGPGEEGAMSCTTDAAGNVYLTGFGSSTTGIASGGFQNTYGGGNNQRWYFSDQGGSWAVRVCRRC